MSTDPRGYGMAFDCPRCDSHYYANLPLDGTPTPFTCAVCGWRGSIDFQLDNPPFTTFKEATDEQDPA